MLISEELIINDQVLAVEKNQNGFHFPAHPMSDSHFSSGSF
jgi:hypothetical protein